MRQVKNEMEKKKLEKNYRMVQNINVLMDLNSQHWKNEYFFFFHFLLFFFFFLVFCLLHFDKAFLFIELNFIVVFCSDFYR